jgi:hypothetical protein
VSHHVVRPVTSLSRGLAAIYMHIGQLQSRDRWCDMESLGMAPLHLQRVAGHPELISCNVTSKR